jgi:hypothetical protein
VDANKETTMTHRDYEFVPNAEITTPDGRVIQVCLTDLVEGAPAYTRAEWDADDQADWERDENGGWTFQGRPVAVKIRWL